MSYRVINCPTRTIDPFILSSPVRLHRLVPDLAAFLWCLGALAPPYLVFGKHRSSIICLLEHGAILVYYTRWAQGIVIGDRRAG